MIKNVLSDIGGVGIYGIISVTLFFFVFLSAVVWACLYRKSFLKSMESLPLHDGTIEKGDFNHE